MTHSSLSPQLPVSASAPPPIRGRLLRIGWWMMLGVFLLGLAAWVDSYCWCRRYTWGDRHRGNYTFVTSSFGSLFLEKRTNCDIDHHFSRHHQRAYRYGAYGPTVTSMELLGFGYFVGTEYGWYQNLYPVTSFPAYTDPRWQREPFRTLRIPYWPAILIGAALSLPWLPRRIRAWRAGRRFRHGLCMTCGYDLTGNTSGICPECGKRVICAPSGGAA